jgi:hypothetical protein
MRDVLGGGAEWLQQLQPDVSGGQGFQNINSLVNLGVNLNSDRQ